MLLLTYLCVESDVGPQLSQSTRDLYVGGDEQGDVGWPRDGVELVPPATDDHRHEEAENETDRDQATELVAVVREHFERPARNNDYH